MPINITYITGSAGTGKTTLLRNRVQEDPHYGKLCATTGVAATNLETVTLHSLLKVFNPSDFTDKRRRARILSRLDDLNVFNLIIDEASMLNAEMGTAIVDILDEYGDMDLILSGDFAQLPPVDGRYLFEAGFWPRVVVEKLTTIYRQDNLEFLEALALARQGLGTAAGRLLSKLCSFSPRRDSSYPGICAVATKAEAHSFNQQNLEALPGDYITHSSSRWGDQHTDWKHIPDQASLKVGCRVRIRANRPNADDKSTFDYVNGDTGTLLDKNYTVRLDRNGQEITVMLVVRYNDVAGPCDNSRKRRFLHPDGTYEDQHYIGSVTFLPLEPGYAFTVHSLQGLSLDSGQISLASLNQFHFNRGFGQNLAYVALSRLRSPERLRIHGTAAELGSKIKIDPRVNQWI